MDVYEIRSRNMEQLLVDSPSQTLEGLARQANVLANYLSQIRGGSRRMGDKAARKLEAGLGKPSGWMDTPHFETTDAALNAAEMQQAMAVLSQEDRDALLKHARLLVKNTPPGPNNPFPAAPKPHKPSRGGTQ